MSHVQLAIRISLSLLLVIWLAAKLDWIGLAGIFTAADWRLLAAVLLASPVLVGLLAWRLQLLLRTQHINLPFGVLLQMTWAGQFFNTFLPGTTGGDVFKLYQIGRLAPQARAAGAAAVVLDRLLALLALLVLSAGAFLAEPVPVLHLLRQGVGVSRAGALAFIGLLGTVLAVYLLRNRLRQRGGRLARILNALSEVFTVVRSSLRINRLTMAAGGLALATHLGNFFGVFLLARALQIEISFFQTLLMMPVVLLVIMLPVTINGHGLREIVMIGYFGLLHIGGGPGLASGREMAVALSLVFVANDLCCALPGGVWHLLFPPLSPRLPTPVAA